MLKFEKVEYEHSSKHRLKIEIQGEYRKKRRSSLVAKDKNKIRDSQGVYH